MISQPKTDMFDQEAAVAVVLYVASNVKDPSLHRIFKILYFADRAHLERYGRFIAGDSYVAMKHGPVPKNIYDMLKAVRGDRPYFMAPELAEELQGYFGIEGSYVRPRAEPDLDALSDSDLACLDASIETCGDKTFGELTALSRDEAWASANENGAMSIEQVASTLSNAGALLEYLRDPHPG
ncbi:MAG: Panacea domain-containing protein [Trueperaceae bacterium]|nr:Panacea domain-containing protein [Trueperaceae bacterium]